MWGFGALGFGNSRIDVGTLCVQGPGVESDLAKVGIWLVSPCILKCQAGAGVPNGQDWTELQPQNPEPKNH